MLSLYNTKGLYESLIISFQRRPPTANNHVCVLLAYVAKAKFVVFLEVKVKTRITNK